MFTCQSINLPDTWFHPRRRDVLVAPTCKGRLAYAASFLPCSLLVVKDGVKPFGASIEVLDDRLEEQDKVENGR